jgi:hypothetical protein
MVRGLLLTAALPAGSIPCVAQSPQIRGRVTDSQNAVIQGAVIRVVDQATGIERKSASNAEGLYVVPFLLPGSYQIYVQALGFSTACSSSIALDAGQTLAYNVQLQVGQVSQSIVVSGALPMMQTQDSSVGQVIPAQTIDRTPLNGRNWVYIAQLTAGVAPPEGSRGNQWAARRAK